MIVPDGNILTSLLTDFTAITANSTNLIKGYAVKVLFTLISIDLIIATLIMLIEDSPLGQAVIRRTLKYGAFAFMVYFYKDIINAFGDSFVLIGLKAAGDTLTAKVFTNPSQITTMGFDMIMPLMNNMVDGKSFGANNGNIIDKVISLPTVMMLGFTYILILFCFFAIAINIFVVYIEFAVLTSIGLILVPFGVWDKTEFIFDKIKNGIITFGIKFMTLAFVVSISFNIIKSWQLPPDPTFQQSLYLLVGMLAITYLCHHAPSVAAGIASGGGGSMSGAALGGFAGTVAGNAMKAGGTTVTAGKSVGGVAGTAIMGRAVENKVTGQTERVGGLFGRGGVFEGMKGGSAASPPPTTANANTSTPPETSTSGVNLNSVPEEAINTGTSPSPATPSPTMPVSPSGVSTPAATPTIKPVVTPPAAPSTDTSIDLK